MKSENSLFIVFPVDIIPWDVDRVHWMLTPRLTSCSVPVDIMAMMSTVSTGTWSQTAGGSTGFVVYLVDIMALMSTGYTGFLTSLRSLRPQLSLQNYVYPVDWTLDCNFYRELTGTRFSLFTVCPVDRARGRSTGYTH
ncbi:hypothetical protein AAC387_Pa12g0354 [Persea americana]